VSRLNVREAATLDAPVVGVALRNERLCVVGYQGDWARVVTPLDGRRPAARLSGFVSRGFVSHREASAAEFERMGCVADAAQPRPS
jgi:hypothetical protein